MFFIVIYAVFEDGENELQFPAVAASLDEAIEEAKVNQISPPPVSEVYRAVESAEGVLLAISKDGWKH